MKRVKLIYKQLTSFLNLKVQNKKEVLDWYDDLSNTSSETTPTLEKMQNAVKTRLMHSIRKDRARRLRHTIARWSAAAVATFVLGYFGFSYFNKEILVTTAELAQIMPGQGKATIVLENGQQIDLDQLEMHKSIQIGESLIIKDAQGEIRYQDAKNGSEKVQYNSLQIPKGGMYQLTLKDGTRVTLNSDSKLTYPSSFGAGDRVVKLEGEAYFEVHKTTNKSRFIVESRQQRVQVLGTKFNIKSYLDQQQVETTLAEGSVLVHNALDKGKQVLLKPDEQAVVKGGTIKVKSVNVESILSWTQGQFYFDGANTEAVLAEIARWYDINIQYEPSGQIDLYKGKIPRNLPLDRLIELLNYAELKTKALIGKDKRISLIIN